MSANCWPCCWGLCVLSGIFVLACMFTWNFLWCYFISDIWYEQRYHMKLGKHDINQTKTKQNYEDFMDHPVLLGNVISWKEVSHLRDGYFCTFLHMPHQPCHIQNIVANLDDRKMKFPSNKYHRKYLEWNLLMFKWFIPSVYTQSSNEWRWSENKVPLV